MSVGADILVEVEDESWSAVGDVEAVVVRAATAALAGEMPALPNARVAVLLTDDDTVGELNGRFRGRDAPTNVLSFPAVESAGEHLGDVALAYGVCAREAVAQGKRLTDHLSHLVVHGVLHLRGFDHQTDDEAEAMEDRERAILSTLGVADPYLVETADV